MGAIFGYLILGQTLSAQQIIGIVAVMIASVGAVYIATSKKNALSGQKIMPQHAVVACSD